MSLVSEQPSILSIMEPISYSFALLWIQRALSMWQKNRERKWRITIEGFNWLNLEAMLSFLSKLQWPKFNQMGLGQLKERLRRKKNVFFFKTTE